MRVLCAYANTSAVCCVSQAIAWIGSIYNAYYDVHQLWDVYLQVRVLLRVRKAGKASGVEEQDSSYTYPSFCCHFLLHEAETPHFIFRLPSFLSHTFTPF